MIKGTKKSNNTEVKKTIVQILLEYIRTIVITFLVAIVFTTMLTIHARNEMIKNLYANDSVRQKIDEQIAKQIVAQSDLTESLQDKDFAICMQVGNIYESAHDYMNAEYAYHLALKKAKRGNYKPYYKLATVLIAQEKFDDALELIESVPDEKNIDLVKFKTKAYLNMGDKYYSIGKFLSAAKNFEKSKFYYEKFTKRDRIVDESLINRLVHSYVNAADIIVKNGYNSDAIRFLKKALEYAPNDYKINYKMAIIYTDLDPLLAVEYFEPLLKKIPQKIDYSTYNKALMKAANIYDLQGEPTKAKYYRYKIHSIDIFVNNKVVYKNDLETKMTAFKISHVLFRYGFKANFIIKNISSTDILNMTADFVLKQGNKIKETISVNCVNKDNPLLSNGGESDVIEVNFKKKLLTRNEMEQYHIDMYLYKDEKFKTHAATFELPLKSFGQIK